jgi:hypothetical protein
MSGSFGKMTPGINGNDIFQLGECHTIDFIYIAIKLIDITDETKTFQKESHPAEWVAIPVIKPVVT